MRRLSYFAFAACCASSPALAQPQGAAGGASLPSAEEIANRDTVTVGIGGAILPDYDGSDDYKIIPAGAIRGKVSGFSFTTRGTYFYFDAVPHRGADKVDFNVGPVIGARINSRRHIDDEVVKLLPKRNLAIEAGVFAGVSLHGLADPYDTLAFRLDVLHDVANAHK